MKLIGLVDCNNFFVSCERVFNPKIKDKPAMVLSSNDGCVIARSQEVKDLGIEMGVPVFKVQKLINENNIHINSTNFNLYRDMSSRVMNILREFANDVEVYSIDEAFIDMSRIKDPIKFCNELRDKIYQYIGIPVSIGIAPNKTLAKLANKVAKQGDGVFFLNQNNCDTVLKDTEIRTIWGIGSSASIRMNKNGIVNAYQLKKANPAWINKNFGKTGLETAEELKGRIFAKINSSDSRRKSIISSKTFGEPIRDKAEIEKVVFGHIENVARQLREEKSVLKRLTVLISTGFYQNNGIYHERYTSEFDNYTDDTIFLIKEAKKIISKIYKSNILYKKAGVCVSSIIPKDRSYRKDLFGETTSTNSEINSVLDDINKRFGQDMIRVSSSLQKNNWKPKSNFKSNQFTTDWCEILSVNSNLNHKVHVDIKNKKIC